MTIVPVKRYRGSFLSVIDSRGSILQGVAAPGNAFQAFFIASPVKA
jgi:hypothetical protein